MSSAEDRITDIMNQHQYMPADMLADTCTGCDWTGAFREAHRAHLAAIIAEELGL